MKRIFSFCLAVLPSLNLLAQIHMEVQGPQVNNLDTVLYVQNNSKCTECDNFGIVAYTKYGVGGRFYGGLLGVSAHGDNVGLWASSPNRGLEARSTYGSAARFTGATDQPDIELGGIGIISNDGGRPFSDDIIIKSNDSINALSIYF